MAQRLKKNCRGCAALRTTSFGGLEIKRCVLNHKWDYVGGERVPAEMCPKPRTKAHLTTITIARSMAQCPNE